MLSSRSQAFWRLNHWLEEHPRLGLTLLTFLLLLQINPWWYPTPDACSYYSIAGNLAREHTLGNLGEPQLWFAPGYPLLISPLFLLDEHPFLWLSVSQALFGILFMLGVYVWTRRVCPEAAFLIAALAVVNVLVWHLLRRTLSEIAFMAVLIWSVNALHRLLGSSSVRQTLARLLPAVVLVALAAIIRPAGVVLVAGLGVVLLLRAYKGDTSWTQAIGITTCVGLPAALLILGLMFREAHFAEAAGARTYLDNFAQSDAHWSARYLEGLRLCVSELGRVAIPGMHKSYGPEHAWLNLNTLLFAGLFLVIAVGWWLLVRTRMDVLAWSFPFYLLLHVLYAMDSGARFFVPMLPLAMVCLWVVFERLGAWRRPLFNLVFTLHLIGAGIQWLAVDMPRARRIHADWASMQAIASVLREDGNTVAVAGMDSSKRHQLQILLDRRIANLDEDGNEASRTCWLVLPVARPMPAGYAERAQLHGLRLMHAEGASTPRQVVASANTD
jgi:hypothetical protein